MGTDRQRLELGRVDDAVDRTRQPCERLDRAGCAQQQPLVRERGRQRAQRRDARQEVAEPERP
jgi:hypothetical protein